MKTRTHAALAISAAALAAAAFAAPTAQASTHTYSNQGGDVRCEIYDYPTSHTTLCVSDAARPAHPECNPPQQLIPAIKVEKGWVGELCWNQGFTQPPEKLSPMSVRNGGGTTVFAAPGGDLFVFDTIKMALIQVGKTNRVLFPGF
ncbi:MAG: hypothetical protein DI609_12200 [Corynebacterium urealyticum]|uniref:Secreted protein n=1 Tax=Corynebacterium urealyticum TaxID=43771 RepID=A0A2W5CSB2_9CORY|nr:MAG: hypothetical protein DI609_12200 [Corynebacterium urealyticum]